METINISIQGHTYPCRVTVGALVQYKKFTGKEVFENVEEAITFLYCCLSSTAIAEDMKFDYSLEKFINSISVEDLSKWTEVITEYAINKLNFQGKNIINN